MWKSANAILDHDGALQQEPLLASSKQVEREGEGTTGAPQNSPPAAILYEESYHPPFLLALVLFPPVLPLFWYVASLFVGLVSG